MPSSYYLCSLAVLTILEVALGRVLGQPRTRRFDHLSRSLEVTMAKQPMSLPQFAPDSSNQLEQHSI